MNSLQDEPSWYQIPWGSGSAFTRPLLGSELLVDQLSVFYDGLADCCMGFSFTTSLPPAELEARLLDAFMRLRFVCPIIASSLEKGIHDPDLRSWLYVPAQNVYEVRQWVREAVVWSEPMHTEDFIACMSQRRLPYVLANGSKQILRCFVLNIPEKQDAFAIFFHGTHALMDARPTINALSLLFDFMSTTTSEDVNALQWGTEWSRLPVGPITATGGLREGWNVEGLAFLDKIAKIYANPIPSRSLLCQRTEVATFGKATRVRLSIDSSTSVKVIQRLKSLGFTPTQLFEAAQVLAIFSLNPVPESEASTAHITYSHSIISLARYLVPPYNVKSNFVSMFCLLPIGVRYEDLLATDEPKMRLISLLHMLKSQYDDFLSNPHLPHLMAVQVKINPPREPGISSNPYATTVTNLGVVEQSIRTVYPDAQVPIFKLEELCFGHRIAAPNPQTHVWTMHSTIHVQIQASDIWDEEYLKTYLNGIVRQALVILD